jgi:uncharacterized protein
MTTTSVDGSAHPVDDDARIDSLDTLRGVAILGILLMNVTAFGLPAAYSDPTNAGGATGLDLATWITTAWLFEGTMRGLFTLLFGAGVVLFTERAERANPTRAADLHVRRMLWLVAFGFVNSHLLLWTGDILYEYGVVGLVLYAFRRARPRTLFTVAVVVIAFLVGRGYLDHQASMKLRADATAAAALKAAGKALTKEQQKSADDWKEKLEHWKPPPEKIAEEIATMRGGFPKIWKLVTERTQGARTTFFYEYGFLEDFATMLIGIALFSLGALQGRWRAKHYALLAAGGYLFGLGWRAGEIAWLLHTNFDVIALSWVGNVGYEIGRIPTTLGHVGLVMLIWKSGLAGAALRRLAAVGRMAFSNYLSQSAICTLVFTGLGFGLFGRLERYELYFVVAGIWAVQILWSPWWLARFRYGPAEWLWRCLTYGERQPFRRSATGESTAAAAV